MWRTQGSISDKLSGYFENHLWSWPIKISWRMKNATLFVSLGSRCSDYRVRWLPDRIRKLQVSKSCNSSHWCSYASGKWLLGLLLRIFLQSYIFFDLASKTITINSGNLHWTTCAAIVLLQVLISHLHKHWYS